MLDVLRTLFRTSFLRLSGVKRWMMRLALLGVLAGGTMVATGVGQGEGGGVDWSQLSLTSGVGYVAGFLVGATVRLFFKVAFFGGLLLLGLGWGLSAMGLLDLPWSSFGEAMSDLGAAIDRQTEAVRVFLSGYLPAGGATATGLGAGLTQRPEFDDDTD